MARQLKVGIDGDGGSDGIRGRGDGDGDSVDDEPRVFCKSFT